MRGLYTCFALTHPKRFRSKRSQRVIRSLACTAIAVEALWFSIHHIPGFGPALADGVRAVVGPGPVAWAEDVAYGIADTVNRWRYEDAPPKTFWEPPPTDVTSGVQGAESGQADAPKNGAEAGFPPPAFKPPHEKVAAKGDGVWMAMPAASGGEGAAGAPLLYRSLVHPDPKRSFAAVAIVAIDLTRIDLRLMPGTKEPSSISVPSDKRQGLIEKEDITDLVAVFNGGFKAMHGHYGMMINGQTYLPPRDVACTVSLYRSGLVRIGTWTKVKENEAEMAAYRQTPPCLVEAGELNPNLSEYNRNWGATVSGETIIRRSAVGVDSRGTTLFYALGEAVTAQSLGVAMKAAGAVDAAQLDVNYAYPRFLLFEHKEAGKPPIAASALIPGIEYDKWDYTVEPSLRDFFYLKRKRSSS